MGGGRGDWVKETGWVGMEEVGERRWNEEEGQESKEKENREEEME